MQETLTNIWNQIVAFVQSHPDVAMLLVVGLVAGWLASMLLGGRGLLRDLIVGVLGAFVGGFLQQLFHFHFGLPDILERIAVATIGAIVVIILGRFVSR
jgi:uncharacterized membrane protein YeaQ/YmgE (transglycosylase-associated protein family)